MSALLPSDEDVRIFRNILGVSNEFFTDRELRTAIAAWNRRTAPVGDANKTRNRRLVGFEVYDELAPRTRAIYEDCIAPECAQRPTPSPAEELAQIEAMLSDGQGDDEGPQILPDFEPSDTTVAKVEACLHLLEKRRDVIAAPSHPSQEDVARVIDPEAVLGVVDQIRHQNWKSGGVLTMDRDEAADAILALMCQTGDGWQDIATPPEDRHRPSVLIYNPVFEQAGEFPGHAIHVSNIDYILSGNASKAGYTHWRPLPAPPAKEGR